MIPVSIVTGFLGSGKTTLISRVLRDPAFGRTAVIVNEFGEVALDHDLIATSDDSVLTLNTGCLCCAVQTDLARTLMDLFQRRQAGAANYDRVLIETSGLSDPAPILQSMMSDNSVLATHAAPSVITLVDTIHGLKTLRDHAEARSQVALADGILISKTDLQPASDSLIEQLEALNPSASRRATSEAATADLFVTASVEAVAHRLASAVRGPAHDGIDTFTIVREQPLPALALTMLLQAVAEHCGPRLLRMKGLVSIAELPGQPAVIHGVRHVVSAPEFLERWPSGDERTRIVFITKGVPLYFVSRLLDAIEEEVREEINTFQTK
ncbi:MAG TPA: GTP-binding protein [Acetobacteraceae bacterium]|nr:GTP-binding protein [Acetobacteraceae bacterium]